MRRPVKLPRAAAILAIAILLLPIAASATTPITTTRVAFGLTRPVFVTSPVGDERVFIVEQRGGDNKGRIKILKNGNVNAVPFLTTATLATGNEEGLLGLAFPPDYAATRAFYIYYTDATGNNHVARHRTKVSDPDRADSIGTNVLTLFHPGNSNHNGGWIAFGPDGYLWIATGDGGSAGDPPNNAQNVNSFLGKILRIAVDTTGTYTSPPDNPFAGATPGLDEIWSLGSRNPFRCSFDRETHDFIIGDVGQDQWEEIDYRPFATGPGRGANYGWSCWEGDVAFNTGYTTPCTACSNTSCFVFPVHTYDHSAGRCSVTGGYVYRGCAIPDLRGTYFFADYCGAQIYSGKLVPGDLQNVTDRTADLDPLLYTISSVSSFGEDKDGELYICDLGGEVFKIVPEAPVTEADQPALRVQSALGDTLGSTGLGNALLTGVVPFTHPGSRIKGVGYLRDAQRRGCETKTATSMFAALTLGSWDIDLSASVAADSATLTRQFVFTNRGAGAAALDFRDVVAPFLEGDADHSAEFAPAGPGQSALLVQSDADLPNLYVAHQGFAIGAAFAQDLDAASSVESRIAADQPLSGATEAGPGTLAMALGFDFGSVAPAARETVVVVTRLSVSAPLDAGDAPPLGGVRILRAVGPVPFRSQFTFVLDAPAGTGLRSLDVYDTRGRRITRLVAPQALTGPRTIVWDGRDAGGARVPSGLYFVRARTTAGDATLRAMRIE